MQTFNRTNLKLVREAMNKALKDLGIEGVEAKVGNCRFSDNQATFKVEVTTAGAKEDKIELLESAMKLHDIPRKTGNGHTIVDYHPRKRKYPFIVVGPKGGRWKMSPSQVKHALGV